MLPESPDGRSGEGLPVTPRPDRRVPPTLGASPFGGLLPGSTPWPAGASHWEPSSASPRGHPALPPHWGGSA